LSETIAWFSAADEPFGLSRAKSMPYFFLKAAITPP
jgi:hypothetical protein